uniref:Uncharacterized protein n=1 Tax=Tanacetum cinerariifolium TaxID=118510 RepID=A0A699I338_TANCI|nr:hypothetical protein [Tanacetum cinerariifolium]
MSITPPPSSPPRPHHRHPSVTINHRKPPPLTSLLPLSATDLHPRCHHVAHLTIVVTTFTAMTPHQKSATTTATPVAAAQALYHHRRHHHSEFKIFEFTSGFSVRARISFMG